MTAPAYDPNNIFAKILRKEAPCHFVYEDADTFAFLDIMPRSDGHALVIPKSPARNILDAAPGLLVPVIHTAQRVAIAAMKAFNADGVTVSQFSEAAGGQVVYLYALLDDNDRAFAWLMQGLQQKTYSMPFLKEDPTWDDIRSDSRFPELVRRVGIPDANDNRAPI